MKLDKNRPLFICGDIHGDLYGAFNLINRYGITNSYIIFCGDVGLGYHSDNTHKHLHNDLTKLLAPLNNTFLFMRGNHDNPDIFNIRWKEFSTSHIHVLRDYTLLEHGEKAILCIGGATSIDRKVLQEGVNYWKDEPFVFDPNKVDKFELITHVITHNSPSFCAPVSFGPLVYHYMENDSESKADLLRERALHDSLYDYLTKIKFFHIEEWHYGHFHFNKTEKLNDTKFVLNGIMNITEIV